MARFLHPKLFPECSTSILIPESIERSMEVYWRVKSWRFDGSFKYGENLEDKDTISFVFDVSNPQFGSPVLTETDLVCPKSRSSDYFLDEASELISVTFFHANNKISFDCQFQEFGSVDGPLSSDDTAFTSPMTFKMGSYSRTMYASGGDQANLKSTISLTALEWWPYKDASGRALYNTATGQRI